MEFESRIKLAVAGLLIAVVAVGSWIVVMRSGDVRHDGTPDRQSTATTTSVATDAESSFLPSVGSRSAQQSNFIAGQGLGIVGRVFDREEQPVEGARIAVYHKDRGVQHAESDSDGAFGMWELQPGEYRVSAAKAHYNDAVIESVRAGERNALLYLTPMSGVTGAVVDALTLEPVSSFDVAALGAPPGDAKHWERLVNDAPTPWRPVEDSNGEFEIEDVPSEQTTAVGIRAAGYAPAYAAVDPIPSGMIGGPVVVELQREARVEGRVIGPDGIGVADTAIYTGHKPEGVVRARSDATGFFSIGELSGDNVQLTAAHADYLPATIDARIAPGDTTPVDIRLGEGGVITGTVWKGDAPKPNQTVVVSKLTPPRVHSQAITDASGQYRIQGIPAGEVDVIVESTDPSSTLQQIAMVELGMSTTVDFYFPEYLSAIAGTITVQGEIPRNALVKGVIVTGAGETSFQNVADDRGVYAVDDMVPGAGWMDVSAVGADGVARTKQIPIELGENESLTVDVDFSSGVAVYGSVQGLTAASDGEVVLLPGAINFDQFDFREYLELARSQVAASPIGANGEYRMDGIQPGTYTVGVIVMNANADTGDDLLANVSMDWQSITITGDEDAQVELSITAAQ